MPVIQKFVHNFPNTKQEMRAFRSLKAMPRFTRLMGTNNVESGVSNKMIAVCALTSVASFTTTAALVIYKNIDSDDAPIVKLFDVTAYSVIAGVLGAFPPFGLYGIYNTVTEFQKIKRKRSD